MRVGGSFTRSRPAVDKNGQRRPSRKRPAIGHSDPSTPTTAEGCPHAFEGVSVEPTFTGHCWDPTNPHLTSRLRTSAGLQCACGRPAADTHDRRGATVPRNRVVRYAGHPSVRASDSYHPAFRTAGHRTLERGLPCLLTPMRHHRGQRASGRRSTTTPSSPTPTMIGRSPQASRSG